jgi:hypothetical protein
MLKPTDWAQMKYKDESIPIFTKDELIVAAREESDELILSSKKKKLTLRDIVAVKNQFFGIKALAMILLGNGFENRVTIKGVAHGEDRQTDTPAS